MQTMIKTNRQTKKTNKHEMNVLTIAEKNHLIKLYIKKNTVTNGRRLMLSGHPFLSVVQTL